MDNLKQVKVYFALFLVGKQPECMPSCAPALSNSEGQAGTGNCRQQSE